MERRGQTEKLGMERKGVRSGMAEHSTWMKIIGWSHAPHLSVPKSGTPVCRGTTVGKCWLSIDSAGLGKQCGNIAAQ